MEFERPSINDELISNALLRIGPPPIRYNPHRLIGIDGSYAPKPARIVLPYGNRKRPKWLRRHRRMLRNGWFVLGVQDGAIAYGRAWHRQR